MSFGNMYADRWTALLSQSTDLSLGDAPTKPDIRAHGDLEFKISQFSTSAVEICKAVATGLCAPRILLLLILPTARSLLEFFSDELS